MMKRTLLFIILAGLFSNSYSQNTDSLCNDVAGKIDRYIAKVQDEWKIPGIGVALIKDGNIIIEKGYGVKDLSGNEKIDKNTVFQIGSVSKSFTAAVIAQLVDEGLVKWEDTVKNILPDFQMYDPWVTSNMQVKDIMTHRSGLAEQTGTYIPNLGYDREDVYKMLKLLKPAYSFRGDYKYNNITFIIASEIIEKITSKSWEENIRERIFNKIGMRSSSIGGEDFRAAENFALPYGFSYKDEGILIEPLYGDEQALWWLTVIGPAGGINSTPHDLVKWAEFHLNMGKVNGTQIISEEQMRYLHKGQTITSQNEDKITLYGQCWYVEQTKKGRLYFHTGTTWGMTALCFWHPGLNLAMAILVNSEVPAYPRYAIMRRTIDLFLNLPDHDYSKEYFEEWLKENKKSEEKKAAEEPEEKKTAPDNKQIEGKYSKDELFGDAEIFLREGELFIKIGKKGFERKLNHVNGNKYQFRCDGSGFTITFKFEGDQRKASSLEIDFGEGENFGPWTRIKNK